MKSANDLRKIFSVFLIAITLLLSAPLMNSSSFMSSSRMQALAAKPLTPEAAAYEIDHADNAETAGKRIQQRSDRYKQAKDNDGLPIEKAAKTASKNTQNAIQQAADLAREKLNSDETTQ